MLGEDRVQLDGIIDKWFEGSPEGRPGALLGILEEIQERERAKYLSEESLTYVAEKTGTPLSRLYSIATFYSYFNLKPQGEHAIVVCRGTACHTRGSRALLIAAAARLGAVGFNAEEDASFTTDDLRFTVRTVACFGQCALAPVVAIDGVIHSRLTVGALEALLRKLGSGGAK